jgi:hypothetical protein
MEPLVVSNRSRERCHIGGEKPDREAELPPTICVGAGSVRRRRYPCVGSLFSISLLQVTGTPSWPRLSLSRIGCRQRWLSGDAWFQGFAHRVATIESRSCDGVASRWPMRAPDAI